MVDLHDLVSSFKDIAAVAAVVVGLLMFWWLYVPPIRLVWRCLSAEERFPLVNTLAACRASIWPFNPATFLKQMRLWLELRLLRPEPFNDPGWRFVQKSKRFELSMDDREYRRELAIWKNEIRGKFAALKIREKEPVIEVNDVFRLNDDRTKNGVKQYLLAVSDLRLSLDEEASFLCKVKINEGFLLPLNLLAGLMARFSDDWDPIISSYGDMSAAGFSPLQMSIFDLWLLWGPSVPICTCEQWSGPVTLQYGFGDENNSIRVRVEDRKKKALLDELRQSQERRRANIYPSLHASITGKLWPPSSFIQGQFCGAQCDLQNPDRETFILEYDSHTVIGNAGGSHSFYTAYVWALFVIGRDAKPAVDEIRKEPWLKVVPFFEHANIVDETTYEFAKLQLAHKILTFVKNYAHLEDDPEAEPVRLWYVCALDDSGCGHAVEVTPLGPPIRDVIAALLKQREYRGLAERMVLDDKSFKGLLSGCHLSDVVTRFFENIEQRRDRAATA